MSDKPKSRPDAQPAVEAAPALDGPKRHHYLPKFYLEGFTREGKLALYDREQNQVRVQTPLNTGVISHYYTLKDAQGRRRFELEQMLSEVEGKACLVIEKLAKKETITAGDRSDLAIFVALMANRTPDFIDSVKGATSHLVSALAEVMFVDVERIKVGIRRMPGAPASEAELEKQAQEMYEFYKSGAYVIETDHRWAVKIAILVAFSVAPIFAGRDWIIVHRHDEKHSYVTTDSPITLTTVAPREPSPYGIGYGNTDAMVTFPLNQACVLVMIGKGGGLVHHAVAANQIRHTNLAMADRCKRFVIGRDEALVRSLANFLHLGEKKWRPKMQAG